MRHINCNFSCIQGTEAHAHKLAFYLLSKKPPEKSGLKSLGKGEIDFLEEIRKDRDIDVEDSLEAAASEIEMQREDDEDSADNPAKKRVKRQTAYDFFREMRQMGLRPIDDADVMN